LSEREEQLEARGRQHGSTGSLSVHLSPSRSSDERENVKEGGEEEKRQEEGGRTRVQQSSYSFQPLPDALIASVDLKRGR
jgi:hypothetical protein